MFKTACKIRVACSGLIYEKSLRILRSSKEEDQTGKIITLMSNDLAKLDDALPYLNDVVRGPLEAIVFSLAIYLEFGAVALVGMPFLGCFIPFIGKYSHLFHCC